MTNPLYSVGQHVAVFTKCMNVVIPATTVIESEFDEPGSFMCPLTGELYFDDGGWSYLVAGEKSWLPEGALRPINPDTEYLEDEITINISEKTQ